MVEGEWSLLDDKDFNFSFNFTLSTEVKRIMKESKI